MKKKVIIILLIVLVLIIVIPRKKDTNYQIDGYTIYQKNNYYEIKTNEQIYNFKLNQKLPQKSITHVEQFEDNKYKCILPIFKDKIHTNVFCIYDNTIYLYDTIKNKSSELIRKYNQLDTKYSFEKNNTNDKITKEMTTIYTNNLEKNNYIILNTYKGILIINDKVEMVNLFNNDVYEQKLKSLINNYYIIANYNNKYSIKSFFVIDILSKQKEEIISKYEISYNSIIQGIYNNELYIYDKENNKQYKINIKDKTISLNAKDNIKTYKDNYWIISDDYLFKYINSVEKDYTYIEKDNVFYRNINENKDILTYIGDNIKYSNDLVCRKNIDKIECLTANGIYKTILHNKELEFNNSLSFEVYKK